MGCGLWAATASPLLAVEPIGPVIEVRPSIFSTSTDWEAVTGLRLHEYTVRFKTYPPLVNNGMELYAFDSFPCYAHTESVMVWVGRDGTVVGRNGTTEGIIRMVCIFEPDHINFAWRYAVRNAWQGVTKGLLVCPVKPRGRDITVNMSECAKGKEWSELGTPRAGN